MYHAETTHTSTSITNRIGLLVLCFLLISSFALGQKDQAPRTITLGERVARLGTPGNQDAEDVKQLAADPKISTSLLIENLHTISDSVESSKADGPSMEHVLWLIRALRYITGGMDFCAQSKLAFGSSEEQKNAKYWLGFSHKGCLSFFALWPSRDRIYVAPIDVQKNIISQWRGWYAAYGVKFLYKPLQNPSPEKWLW